MSVSLLLVPTSALPEKPPLDPYSSLEKAMGYAEAWNYLSSLPPVVVQLAPATEPAQIEEAPPVASEGTGECGGATNGADQYIPRETNGSADPVNQPNTGGSGAWGCYQLMPLHFEEGGLCADLGPLYGSSAETQATCASRLPLSAWS